MALISQSRAGLRFFGDDLDPDRITDLLGGAPTHSYRKGDSWSPGGNPQRHRFGSWRRTAEPRQPGDLRGQIEELLRGLTEDLDVWRALSTRYRADVFCGLFLNDTNEGFRFHPRPFCFWAPAD